MTVRNPLTISRVGERLDLEVRQGSTLGPIRHTIFNPPVPPAKDGTPMDLTGCEVRGTVRTSPTAFGPPVAVMTVTWPADRTEGYYEFSFDAGTNAIVMSTNRLTLYWDSEMVDSLGNVWPLFAGTFTVLAESTRPDIEEPPMSIPEC